MSVFGRGKGSGPAASASSSARPSRAFLPPQPRTPSFWTPFDPPFCPSSTSCRRNLHHWFGTDQLGRDVLSMIMPAQESVGVPCCGYHGVFIGVPLGLLAAARRGADRRTHLRGMTWCLHFPPCCSRF